MRCKWYNEVKGICTNARCAFFNSTCGLGTKQDVCKYGENEPWPVPPKLSVEELVKALRVCTAINNCSEKCPLYDYGDAAVCESAMKRQAADMLEKLAAEKDTKKLEWISVKDRLPEEAEPVNVTWVNHRPAPYYSKIKNVEQTATAVYFGGKWYWYSNVCVDMLEEYGRNAVDLLDENIEITHWMSLPKPMKEEER